MALIPLQVFYEFTFYAYVFFADYEGLGIQDAELAFQGGELVFGDNGEYDVGSFFSVAALGFPVSGSADQVFQDVVHDLLRVFFGEDEYLGADVLAVGAIHDQGADCGVDDSDDDDGRL